MEDDALIKIYENNFKYRQTSEKYSKVIVLDLDETIGDFSDLIVLWKIAQSQTQLTQDNFNTIANTFPEFFRMGIFTILEYLSKKKQNHKCNHIYLYTNNKFSPEFPNLIANYVSEKIQADPPLFDKVICAFKIGDKIIEKDRTETQKSYGDLIKCTMLPKSTEICFVDDYFHKKMNHDKIYYIQPISYNHDLPPYTIASRACTSMPEWFSDKKTLIKILSIKSPEHFFHVDLHCKITQKLMYYLKEFFHLTTMVPKTRKNNRKITRFTRKKRIHNYN
jgi:hypothetical protein